jgi:tetratricopeptide (TPR) repeat protein
VIAVGVGWWCWRVHDRKTLLVLLTASVVLGVMFWFTVGPLMRQGGIAAIGGVMFTVALSMIAAVLWAPTIAGYVGRKLGSLIDGGDDEIEAKPFYSIFRAKKTRGKYFEALAEVRKQLENFPNDFEGQTLLAELQAENLNDLPGADLTIQRLCEQAAHAPRDLSYALNRLTDWHLSITKDRESAQRTLEKIIALWPNTELASRAAQRIGRLADDKMLLSQSDRERVPVKKGVVNLGLQRGPNGKLRAPEVDQEKLAAQLVTQLERHPLDTHAREQLAFVYAKHYRRLDLAKEQLEQLIGQPAQAARQIVHWLNVLADLQVHGGASFDDVKATLLRIPELFPDIAAAEMAQRRIDRLKLEIKGREKTSDVTLGTYEQNVGLKRRP